MIFGKKKKQGIFNSVDDSRTVVHDFRLRLTDPSYESYRTVDYRLYHKLEEDEMIPLLDDHLAKLFAGEVDSGNAGILENTIFAAAVEAVSDLRRQKVDHDDTIRRLINRRTADRQDIESLRDKCVNERDDINSEYEKICQALNMCEEV